MKAVAKTFLMVAGILLAATPLPLLAQEEDYLTREEVEEVRETQEPVKRVRLFLKYADLRLAEVERLAEPSDGKRRRGDDLQDAMNNYIRAIDDAAANLEGYFERGGVDLRKLRKPMKVSGEDLLSRLTLIREPFEQARRDLRFDMEDALEATQDLFALGNKIPEEFIPPKVPALAGATGEEKPREPGRPTLKRKKEKPPDP